MKRTLALCAVLGSMMAGHGFAKAKYGMAGCGLGSVVMGAQGGQISAATTNGTAYNQFFGITSGTSNCVPTHGLSSAEQVFIRDNFASFEKDVSRGYGQSLDAFTSLLKCQDNAAQAASEELKNQYSEIFKEPGAFAVLIKAKKILRHKTSISKQCPNLS